MCPVLKTSFIYDACALDYKSVVHLIYFTNLKTVIFGKAVGKRGSYAPGLTTGSYLCLIFENETPPSE